MPQSFIYFENFRHWNDKKKLIYPFSRHAEANILCVKILKLCTSQQQPFLPSFVWMSEKLHWHNKSRPFASAALLFIVFCALRFVLHNQPCSRRSGKEHWYIPEKQPTMAFCRWSFAHFGEATPEWIPHIFCHAFVCAQFDGLTRHLHLMPGEVQHLWESYGYCTSMNKVLWWTQVIYIVEPCKQKFN